MQMIQIMSFIMLSAGLFDTILGGSNGGGVIPTREEQANLLTNVQEVFEQVKLLVNVEAISTDESVVNDIDRMVARARDKLILVEELALTRLSLNLNTVTMLDYRSQIQDVVLHGVDALKQCISRGSDDIRINSRQLTNATDFATSKGQDFLDSLGACSKKPGLHVISCYKKVIAKDVVPLKNMLLEAIEAHKKGHSRTIQVRTEANDCVDAVLEECQKKIEQILVESIGVTKS